jgi:hypothetical protein
MANFSRSHLTVGSCRIYFWARNEIGVRPAGAQISKKASELPA